MMPWGEARWTPTLRRDADDGEPLLRIAAFLFRHQQDTVCDQEYNFSTNNIKKLFTATKAP